MRVKLCWKTKDTLAHKHRVVRAETIKEAMEKFKLIKGDAIEAWLTRSDGWRDHLYKTLL